MNITFMADDDASCHDQGAAGARRRVRLHGPQKADWGTSAICKDLDGNMFVLSTP